MTKPLSVRLLDRLREVLAEQTDVVLSPSARCVRQWTARDETGAWKWYVVDRGLGAGYRTTSIGSPWPMGALLKADHWTVVRLPYDCIEIDIEKGHDVKPRDRVTHEPSKRSGEVLVTFQEEGAAHVDWRPDGQSTETARQSEFTPELD